MTLPFARITSSRFCAAIVCAFVALSFLRAADAASVSNGLLDCLGEDASELTVDESLLAELDPEDAGTTSEPLFSSLALAGLTSDFGSDAALVSAIGEERATGESSVDYSGNGLAFTQDVVVRGSIGLPSFSALQVWGNAYSGSGHVKPVGVNDRVTRNNTGASLGLNLPLGAATITGFYNYHRDREFLKPGRVQQLDNSYGMAFYLNVGGFYLSASGLYGKDKYKARSASLGAKNFNGSQSAGYVETGYSMMQGGMFVLEPFAGYHYANVRHDKFDTSLWTTSSGVKKYNACTATLGSRVNLNLAGLDVFTIQGRVAWVTEMRKRTESLTTFNYARVPGTYTPASPYYVGNGGGGDVFWAGTGLRLSLLGMFAFSVDYDCLFNKRQTLHEGSLGVLFGF